MAAWFSWACLRSRYRGWNATVAILTPLEPIKFVAPLRLTANYGLFAVMTMDRPELVIEGSLDGQTWSAEILPYKPGRLDRAPAQVAPHMPRLDWQLWFAALGGVNHNRWLVGLLEGLLKDHQPIRQLFGSLLMVRPSRHVFSGIATILHR